MKKFSILLLILTICFTFSFVYADSSSGEQKEDTRTYDDGYDDGYDEGYSAGKSSAKSRTPVVRVEEVKDVPEVEAGEDIEIKIKVKNDSSYPASGLVVSPILDEAGALVYERPLNYRFSSSLMSKKEASITFDFKTSPTAKSGTYPIKFKLEYKNSLGEVFTREDASYYRIKQEKTKPILNIANIEIDRANVQYGDIFTLSFDIYNIGGSEAKDTEIKLEGFNTETIMPIDSRDYNFIGTIEAKSAGSKSVSRQAFDFKVSPDIEVKDTSFTATIKYLSYDDKEYSMSKTFYITGIKVKPKESGEKKEEEKKEEPKYPKPKMIISSYGISPNALTAGDEFTFSFNFKNTSKEKNIRNIKITIGSTEGCFIITKGSNTFYIENMSKGQSLYRQIDLKAKRELKSDSYEVIISFDYEDYDGNEYTSTEKINIPVTEYSKLVINSATSEGGYVNTPVSLSFDYVNMGNATLSNVVASVKGDVTPLQENTYIGNIQAGNSEYYDIEVTPTKEGMNYGTLILSYEDSSGKKMEVTRDFEINAFEDTLVTNNDSEMIDYGEGEGSEENKPNFETWQIVLSGIGSFLVLFLLTRIITKKIMLKKFEDEL